MGTQLHHCLVHNPALSGHQPTHTSPLSARNPTCTSPSSTPRCCLRRDASAPLSRRRVALVSILITHLCSSTPPLSVPPCSVCQNLIMSVHRLCRHTTTSVHCLCRCTTPPARRLPQHATVALSLGWPGFLQTDHSKEIDGIFFVSRSKVSSYELNIKAMSRS
jgi:hypothetical protein